MTTRSFAFTFVLALGAAAGCSSDPMMSGDDQPNNPGGGDDGGGDDTPRPLDATGNYRVQNTFDIASNAPGTAGDIVNAFIAMTDDPTDPSHWVLSLLIDQLDSGVIKTAAKAIEPTVAAYLNGRLEDFAPTFIDTFKLVGQDVGDITKHFGLNSQLNVAHTATDNAYLATHTFDGAHFHIGTSDMDLKLADYGIQNIVVKDLSIGIDLQGGFTVSENKVPVPYGSIIRVGLDAAIIPLIDSGATNLDDLLEHQIDCAAVGQFVADEVGIGSPATYELACHGGLNYAATLIYQQIAKLDSSALTFDMTGTAKAVDTNSDQKVDKLNTGAWAGTLSYGTSDPTSLASATFSGTRQ